MKIKKLYQSKKNFFCFTILLLKFAPIISSDMVTMIQDHCPEFWHYITSCQNFANTFEDRQKKLKEGTIFKAMDQLEKSKKEYENFQKQAEDCKNKSISKCKDIGKKTYDTLTQMNDYYAQIMTIMHSKDPKYAAPIKKTEKIDNDISFTILTNFDDQIFDKVANFVIRDDVDSAMADNLSNLMDKIQNISKQYNENNSILQKCLNDVSSECNKFISSAYASINEMNNAIATAMNGLHEKYPDLIPVPKKETKTFGSNTVTQITNFDSDKFVKALTSYKELMLPKYLLEQLDICNKNTEGIKTKCEAHLKDYFGREVPIQLTGTGITFVTTLGGPAAIGTLATTVATLAGATGPVGLAVGSFVEAALFGISFIPAVSDALDKFSDWISRSILGKKEDTSYYKQFLLIFEEPIRQETIDRVKKIVKDKIEKEAKIKQEELKKQEQIKKEATTKSTDSTIKKDTLGKTGDTTIKKETLGKAK